MTQDFFTALGENKTLISLQIDTAYRYSYDFCNKLGKACAMNAKKKGSLTTLSCKNGFDANTLSSFIKNLYISEQDHEYMYGDSTIASKMSGEDLEKKIYSNITHFNIETSDIPFNGNMFQIRKKLKPDWPELIQLFATNLENIDLAKCNLRQKRDMELISACIENPIWKTHVVRLNLSGNKITKDGAKILGDVLKKQFTIRYLDLSGNKLGVAGCQAIANALSTNTTLKYLNLYSNQMDVDGARCLKQTLLANDTLEYIDVGSNRLRDKGVLAIAEGISGNKTSALKGISIRYNFVTDDGADKFFGIVIENSGINKVFSKCNYLTEPYITNLEKSLKASDRHIYVDSCDKIKYLDQDLLDRSIWISPINANFTPASLKTFFQDTHDCGLVKDVRVYFGKSKPGKPNENRYAMIEFAHVNSVPRSLRIASKKLSVLFGTKFRIYKAGTANMGTAAAPASKNPATRHAGRGGRGGRGASRGGRRGRGR